MRRMVVLGGGTPLGRRVAASLRQNVEVELAVGIEHQPLDDPAMNEDLEFLSWAKDHRPFAEYLLKEEIDTIVYEVCGLDLFSDEKEVFPHFGKEGVGTVLDHLLQILPLLPARIRQRLMR